jgi:hypothetical protein
MAASPTKTVEVDAELLERARRVADERGVAVSQLVRVALVHELAEVAPNSEQRRPSDDDREQPPLTCIGAFRSGRGDLSKLAGDHVFEPEPFR